MYRETFERRERRFVKRRLPEEGRDIRLAARGILAAHSHENEGEATIFEVRYFLPPTEVFTAYKGGTHRISLGMGVTGITLGRSLGS